MPKARARAGAGAAAGGGAAAADKDTSDEEIMRERRKKDAFNAADDALFVVSWGLWVLGALWFLCYSGGVPETPIAHPKFHADPAMVALFFGIFCGSLSRSSPGGSWSKWRVAWHLLLCPAFGVLALAFYITSTRGRPTPAVPPTNYSQGAAVGCALAAVGLFLTCPKYTPTSRKWSGHVLGRLVALLDGGLGLYAAYQAAISSSGVWAEPIGPVAVVATVAPLVVWSFGTLMCSTDAELLAAIPAAMLQYLSVIIRFVFLEEAQEAAPAAIMLGVHLILYLPLGDSDLNPFFVLMRKKYKSYANLLKEPVSGFGDDGE